MDKSRRILRLDLDGGWSAEELGRVLVNLSDLYNLRLFLELLREDIQEWARYFPDLLDFPPFARHRLRQHPYRPWFPLWQGLPPLDDSCLSRLSELIAPEERLKVWRVEYASPGFSDLAGLGAVIGHLKDFILKLIERRDGRRSRALSEERAELENESLRIQNARNLVALGRDLGYSETEMRTLFRHVDEKQDLVFGLITQRKIKGVSIQDEE